MIEHASKNPIKTLREVPSYADTAGFQNLIRGGFIRRVAAGIYSWLPNGLKVLEKVTAIVRREMVKIGGYEVNFPALLPREPYEATNRWVEYGDNLFKLRDRKNADYLLAPTHEEMFTLLAKEMFSSYKDLPKILFQIQTKYRDEARPRAGLIRGREFLMKDSYSFDLDEAGLGESYAKHRQAYADIFDACGLKYEIVSAQSGAMGGSKSEEFLLPIEIGEDSFITTKSGYAANIEAFHPQPPKDIDASKVPDSEIFDTPGKKSVAEVVEYANAKLGMNVSPAQALKNVVFKVVQPDGESELVIFGVPGDREVDVKRVESQISPAILEEPSDEDFEKRPEIIRGFMGPQNRGKGVKFIIDSSIARGSVWFTGANAKDKHEFNLVFGRDFEADETLDLINVIDGDIAFNGEPVKIQRGIELGHVFALGQKYSKAFDFEVLDADSNRITPQMGSYGIGVSRIVAALAEVYSDEFGLNWPAQVAPYDCIIVEAIDSDEVHAAAEKLAASMDAKGESVLIDDRKISAGIKFKDAELIGAPSIVTIGRSLAEGNIEIKSRSSMQSQTIPL